MRFIELSLTFIHPSLLLANTGDDGSPSPSLQHYALLCRNQARFLYKEALFVLNLPDIFGQPACVWCLITALSIARIILTLLQE